MNLIQALKNIFKKYFLAGTLALVPVIATYLILKAIILWTDDLFMSFLPSRAHPRNIFGTNIPGLGLIATITVILLAGFITRLYVGKKLVQTGDRLISKIPLGRSIYNGIKQFMGTVFSERGGSFKSVVLVEFPRKDIWMLGFVTGEALPEYRFTDGRKWISLFVPTSPNPTTGFYVTVPETEVRPVAIGVDEAFKLVISSGIVQRDSAKSW